MTRRGGSDADARESSVRFDGTLFRETWRGLLKGSNLPGICYTSTEWYEREVQQIFFKEWLCVGRVEDVARVGDFFTVNIAGERVAVVRDERSKLRALLPVCRHRSAIVLSGAGNCRSIVCPYHGWTYRLSGELVGTPGRHQPMADVADFDRRDNGLLAIRVETWAGFIFVNFDAQAQSLKTWLGDLPERLRNYGMENLQRSHTISYEVDCNWKVYVENAADEYHVEFVHRKYMSVDNPYLLENGKTAGPYELWINPYYNATQMAGSISPIKGLDDTQQKVAFQYHIHPNLYVAATPTQVKYLTMVPEGIGKTRVQMSWCFPKETIARPDFEEVAKRDHYPKTIAIVEEDNWISAVVQQGVTSRFRRPGRMSHREFTFHSFQRYVLNRVLTAAERGSVKETSNVRKMQRA